MSLEHIRAFLEASEEMQFAGRNRQEVYRWVDQTLGQQNYSELLAKVDEAHETLSGPATQKILQREFYDFGDQRYERLARLSVAIGGGRDICGWTRCIKGTGTRWAAAIPAISGSGSPQLTDFKRE